MYLQFSHDRHSSDARQEPMENNVKPPQNAVLAIHACTMDGAKTLDQDLTVHVPMTTQESDVNMNTMLAKLALVRMEPLVSMTVQDLLAFVHQDIQVIYTKRCKIIYFVVRIKCNLSFNYSLGKTCEDDIIDCKENSCPPSATCIDLTGKFFCQCPFNLTGDDCRKCTCTVHLRY